MYFLIKAQSGKVLSASRAEVTRDPYASLLHDMSDDEVNLLRSLGVEMSNTIDRLRNRRRELVNEGSGTIKLLDLNEVDCGSKQGVSYKCHLKTGLVGTIIEAEYRPKNDEDKKFTRYLLQAKGSAGGEVRVGFEPVTSDYRFARELKSSLR